MKRHLAFIVLGLFASTISFATESEYLDDLGTINLNLDASETEAIQINYPGYRLGGGVPPHREITDCLIVDIQATDSDVTLAMKKNLANRLIVEDGGRFGQEQLPRLKPEVKGEKVVFRLVSKATYMTHIKVFAKNKESLQANIDAVLKETAIPVNLVYVRGCRF